MRLYVYVVCLYYSLFYLYDRYFLIFTIGVLNIRNTNSVVLAKYISYEWSPTYIYICSWQYRRLRYVSLSDVTSVTKKLQVRNFASHRHSFHRTGIHGFFQYMWNIHESCRNTSNYIYLFISFIHMHINACTHCSQSRCDKNIVFQFINVCTRIMTFDILHWIFIIEINVDYCLFKTLHARNRFKWHMTRFQIGMKSTSKNILAAFFH